MVKDKEYYLLHQFKIADPDEARKFAYQIVKEHGLNFSIYNDENSDMLTVEFDNKKRGILWPATLVIAAFWIMTQFEIYTLGEVIR
jgi:hypothetical protein